MAAYFVAQYTVNNPGLYAEYQKGAGPAVAQYDGEVVVFDVAAESIEGEAPGLQTVVLKFADTDAVKAWYNSPEYQEVVGQRLEATDGFAVISQSMNIGG